jgi:hypothetical protein
MAATAASKAMVAGSKAMAARIEGNDGEDER